MTVDTHSRACRDSLIQRENITSRQQRNEREGRGAGKQPKQMKGADLLGGVNFNNLYIHLGLKFPPKFECPDFEKYDGKGVPTHLKLYGVGISITMMINCWFTHFQ